MKNYMDMLKMLSSADENIDANGDVDEDAAGVAGTVGTS
jgi:hypothetical protein